MSKMGQQAGKSPAQWLSFNRVVWLGALGVAAFLVGQPLVRNAWAAGHWKQTPCRVSDKLKNYNFRTNGELYLGKSWDFWSGSRVERARFDTGTDDWNDTCWVNPNDPMQAVLRIDAATNWSNSSGRVMPAVLLLAGAFVITRAGSRKKRAPGA